MLNPSASAVSAMSSSLPPLSPGSSTSTFRPPEEPPLPLALLPPKKRCAWLWRNPTSDATASDQTPPPAVMPEMKVVRRVRKFAVRTKVVPPGSGAATLMKPTDAAEDAAPAVAVAEEEEQEPGEFVPDKPFVAVCNNAVAASASQSSLLDDEETAAVGEEEAASAGEPPVPENKLVMSSEEGDESGIFGREEMSTREVFVGALNRDAKEEDVRAALAAEAGGEISYVRVIMHNKMKKKKNRGYCFVRFREPVAATRAIAAAQLGDLKICGKPCRIEALDSSKLKIGQGDPFEDYSLVPYREKRPLSTLGSNSSSCMSRNPRARNGSNTYATETSSFGAVPHVIGEYSPLYHHGSIMYLPDSIFYGLAEPWGEIPMRQSGSHRPGQQHGSRH